MGLLIGLLLFCAAGSGVYVPTDARIYEDLDLLKTAGLIKSLPSISKPWTREECEKLFFEAESVARGCQLNAAQEAALARLRWELIKKKPVVGIDLSETSESENRLILLNLFARMRAEPGKQRVSLGVNAENEPADRFFFYDEMAPVLLNPKEPRILDSAGWHNPNARVVSWQDRVLWEMERAYLGVKFPGLRLEMGRDEFFWGPGYLSSVMLSDRAPALDHFQLLLKGRSLKFLAFTAMLSRWNRTHRFLSGQRLEVSLFNQLVLGGAMLNVYTYENAWDFTGMLNPLLPLYFSVANSGHGDNLLMGWDAVLYLPKTKIYGQLFLDNYEFNTRKDAPNCVGLQAGFLLTPAAFEIRAEYALITAFTYYHRIYSIMYENYSVPLGHELGPDADRLWARVSYTPLTWLKTSVAGDWTRRGYYNRGEFLRQSYQMSDTVFLRHYYQFPAKGWDSTKADVDVEIEKVLRLGPELEFSLPRGFYLLARVQAAYYKNQAGVPGKDGVEPEFLLKLEYRY